VTVHSVIHSLDGLRRPHGPPPFFEDRADAGRRLAAMIGVPAAHDVAVVGLARGGVVVAAEVARALGAPLDALAVTKVGLPEQPEYAIGAVAAGDVVFVRDRHGLGDREVGRAVAEAQRRAGALDAALHPDGTRVDLEGRRVYLVDDGIATGTTMVAAIGAVRAGSPKEIVVAAPVASVDGLRLVLREATETMCLHTVTGMTSVGACYGRFAPVDEAAVVAIIAELQRFSWR
jgi:putative phosphoribosyl transferase